MTGGGGRSAAVVLAAGSASRFGKQKLLATLDGKPLVRWAVEAAVASAVDRVLVVLGAEGEAVCGALDGLPVTAVRNPGHRAGMASSIRAGVAALAPETEWAVILLGDQPRVGAGVVDRVLEAREEGRPVVAPFYRGEQGNPVLFHASVFGELRALEGDRGARSVVERDPSRVTRVELELPFPEDVDTPEDHRRLRARGERGG